MQPFLALITPVGDSGGGGQPPGIWGGGGVPMPTPPIPIYPGGSPNPPGIWGGGNVPMPNPPIYMPPGWGSGNPPGIWGPGGPWPGYWVPGAPGAPGFGGGGGGQPHPPGIWGGGNQPFPTPPIVIDEPRPPELPDVPDDVPVGAMLVVVATPDGPKWAYIPPSPGYNPPSGGAVPTPQQGQQQR